MKILLHVFHLKVKKNIEEFFLELKKDDLFLKIQNEENEKNSENSR